MPFALTNDPSQSEISEAINYLLANFGPNLAADPNNGQISGPSGVIIAYLYQYIAVKYADSFDGSLNFSNSPTGRLYYGLRNSNDSVESTNPADYIWYQATGGFGSTKFLFYQTNGGRQINFYVGTTAPDATYLKESGSSIDLDVVTTTTAYNTAAPSIYQWTSSSTPPTRPSTTSTYTWATGAYTAPSGWTTAPTSNTTPGYYLWAITIPLVVNANTVTSTLDWTNTSYPIYAFSSNGANGSVGPDGTRSSSGYVYYGLSSTTAPTAPTLSGFNFVTGTFSTISSNWSTTFTAPPATDTTKFWAVRYSVSEATYGGTQTVSTSTVFNWTNFNGLVTFTNLATNTGTTFIDGGNVTTNTLNVDRVKNNTSGTFNTYVTFGLGTGSGIGGYLGGGAFTSTNLTYYGILAANTGTGFAVGAGSTNNNAATIGAIVAAGAGNSSFSTFKNGAYLGNGISAGTFQTGGASNLQSAVTADIRLAYYTGGTSYAYYITSGAAYPFTAGHDGLQLLTETIPQIGDIMVDVNVIASPTVNDSITQMTVSTYANQKGGVGVFTGVCGNEFVPASLGYYIEGEQGCKNNFVLKPEYANIYDTYRPIGVNAIGEGKINVCGQNGDIAVGDFIVASDMAGKGMKQSNDVFQSYTIAKARQAVTFSSPSDVQMIACIYMGG